MKKSLFLVILISNFLGYSQYTLIPDVIFEKALIGLGIDVGVPDGRVFTANVNGIISLNVSNQYITDLTGIQDFLALRNLTCYKNQLTSLNITKNIDLSDLSCGNNQLTSLDVSKNIFISFLNCTDNLLTSLDVSNNTVLNKLSCDSNKLTSLDVSKNTALNYLNFSENQLTSLDVTKNTNLFVLSCFNNNLTSLDVSKNIGLTTLYCYNNQLTSLNLKNGGNGILYFRGGNNPNLSCIQVDNKIFSNTNWSAFKDATASFSEDCSKTTAPIAPPVITATGTQIYCPGTSQKIVETISISNDPAEPDTDAIYIQISSGYQFGQDLLKLANLASHPTITASWDATAGKLKLYSPTGVKILYTDFVMAIQDVEFSNSSPFPSGTRNFSITIGQANFLPSTGHYYQFVPNVGITWTNAKTAAEALNYYGLKGYLATILSAEEAQIAGEQASGAGWIGGTDQEIEGTWKWVTGPEGLANSGTGIVFWNGLVNGSTPNYAKWNTNEPNQFLGREEDYAHITAPGVGITGSWNDLTITGDPNGNYQPKGFIVEYGGMPGDPTLKISASTTMTMAQLSVTTPNPICASQTSTLQASSTSSSTINWYDASTGGNLLFTGNSFTTPVLNSTITYYIDYGCISRTPITVTVEPLPIANPITIPRQCDDNQDGIFTFNTASLETTLLNGQNNSTVTYLDVANNPLKDANGVLIISPFPANFTTKSQTIQAVITNNTSLKCSNKTTIDFIIDNLPQAFAVPTSLTTACDDDLIPAAQDAKYPFNTSSFESTILGGQIGMKVSYYDKNGIQLASPLPNPFLTETQSITAKVENALNSNCSAVTTINFVVNPLPIVKDVEIIQCDTDLVVDGKTFFNLTVNNTEISVNAANENFTYYNSSNGANNAISADLISNELAFENTTPTLMNIWSRVSNKITGCHSVAKITLKVPATNIPPTYKIPFAPVCDDFLDTNGNNTANNDKRDGITTFDFSATKGTIASLLPTSQTYTINYYKNEADALAELNVIPDISNYRNIGYPNAQDIWIRIDSDLDNACFGIGPYLTLNVEALPVANAVTNSRQCDDDADGIVSFNTAHLESDILNGQLNKTVTYFDQANTPLKDANGVLITSPFPANFTSTSQTIKAVVTNNTPQQCFDEVLIPFIVDVTPVAFAVPSSLTTTCDDEPNPLDQDGKFAFDSSTFETTILGGQTGMIVEYYTQNNVLLSSPLPNPFVTNSQNITVKVVNPINPICTAKTTLNFVVNPVPKIDLNLDGSSDELVCSNLSTFFATLEAGILDGSPTTNYQYIWTKDGSIIGSNSSTLDVNEEGIYTVEVSNNLGCSRIRTITVTASNKATITSIDVVDLTDNNTVTVNVTGPGDYQYSLDKDSGFWQDSNFFNNVPAGIHEIYVNDKNGCGLVSQEIVIVGIPKFFTPNGDGYNDVWEIKGISKYPQAEVQLFDRYGKYLTSLNNINTNWNGMYNGAPLPADDYWYVLNLEKGKKDVKGHFALKR